MTGMAGMAGRSGRLPIHPMVELSPNVEDVVDDCRQRTMHSLPQMARRFGCSTATIRRWWEHSKIPSPLKIGGNLRWDSEELEQWITEYPREKKPPNPYDPHFAQPSIVCVDCQEKIDLF